MEKDTRNKSENLEKDYFIEQTVDILKSIEDVKLLQYLYYFTKLKAEEKAR